MREGRRVTSDHNYVFNYHDTTSYSAYCFYGLQVIMTVILMLVLTLMPITTMAVILILIAITIITDEQ